MTSGPRVRVPASSANLGPAFDALAVAVRLPLEVTVGDDLHAAAETHPAVRAFRAAGGTGPLGVRAAFPGGRGLGFSAAARVAGALAAAGQQGAPREPARREALRLAAELEGHADNAAAALHGGVVAVAGGHVTRVPCALEPAVVLWVPDRENPTHASRRRLAATVAFEDAAFNVGRAALLVAALAAGDVPALRTATEDRLHQDARLASLPESRAALRAALDAGAWGAWLSGSGPSIAAFADPRRAEQVAGALPAGGRVMVLEIDQEGAVT